MLAFLNWFNIFTLEEIQKNISEESLKKKKAHVDPVAPN